MSADAIMVDVFTRARGAIARGFTQQHYARDEEGEPVSPYDSTACSFCVWGAVQYAAPSSPVTRARAIDILAGLAGEKVVKWNDQQNRTQDDVLALFDRAIAHVSI